MRREKNKNYLILLALLLTGFVFSFGNKANAGNCAWVSPIVIPPNTTHCPGASYVGYTAQENSVCTGQGLTAPSVFAECCCDPASIGITVRKDCSWQVADLAGKCSNNSLIPILPDKTCSDSGHGDRPAATDRGSFICCCGTPALDAKPAAILNNPFDDLNVPVPGLYDSMGCKYDQSTKKYTCPKVNCEGAAGNATCVVPWIGQYLVAIYNYALIIIGSIAAVTMMAGGIIWLISGSNASRMKTAKEMIFGSISGLVIMFSSYMLISIINPDILILKPLVIGYIEKLDPVLDGSDSQTNAAGGASCLSDSQLVSIKSKLTTVASDPRLSADAVSGLDKAIEEASKQGVQLEVTSANRGYNTQKRLWDEQLAKFGGDAAKTRKYVADPANCTGNKCYSHCAGVAVDICIKGTASCSKLSAANATYSDDNVKKLQDIMKKAGWVRYCGEWWHFQYGMPPGKACSP
ncbi:MAG: D-alanyl-D-alanine carboxypeptidase family protein [Candidatus Falkowbacteria bacterium]|nr:D-alanyl-D-alanine carboxypeptidase family protein [Candidatus Falkowbacteria bacterium]